MMAGTLFRYFLRRHLMTIFWFFLGVFGAHRFYLGQTGLGLLMLVTLGGFGLIVLLDLFILGLEVKKVNARRKAAIFGRVGLPVLSV